ncbi:hypothetical protein H8959_006469 [Pygathrix nigripes]
MTSSKGLKTAEASSTCRTQQGACTRLRPSAGLAEQNICVSVYFIHPLPVQRSARDRLPAAVCCHGTEGEETPEQSVSVERVPQVRTPEASPSTQKTQSCDMCVSFLTDILHLTDLPGQKPCLTGACAVFHQEQKHHSAEKPLESDVDKASFVQCCLFPESGMPFTSIEVGKDFLAPLGVLQPQAIAIYEQPNEISKCEEAFHHTSDQFWPEGPSLGSAGSCCGRLPFMEILVLTRHLVVFPASKSPPSNWLPHIALVCMVIKALFLNQCSLRVWFTVQGGWKTHLSSYIKEWTAFVGPQCRWPVQEK